VRLGTHRDLELTYCTNIHPANGLDEVTASLRRHAPDLRARLRPHGPFGIGLRLSGAESREMLEGDRLAEFQDFLDRHGLYVFTLNGFPHGSFHGEPVKAQVHHPDWRTRERVEYTLRLAEILARLVPAGSEGSISTSPLSYAGWVDPGDRAAWEAVTRNLVDVAAALVRLRRERGRLVYLAIEPEADGLVEDSHGLVRFHLDWLLRAGGEMLARMLGASREEAEALLLDHVRVCFDACHAAVAYEDPAEVLDRFASAGIGVGKVQLSSALRVPLSDHPRRRAALAAALRPFADSVYLHQVAERRADGTLERYPDLTEALERIEDPDAVEWRVHFHVPIFVDRYGDFQSTQDYLRGVLALVQERGVTRHLEIETYTWDVLPAGLKLDLTDSIQREYEWVLGVLG
jgi:sugar phosphate isomerase/epimerase